MRPSHLLAASFVCVWGLLGLWGIASVGAQHYLAAQPTIVPVPGQSPLNIAHILSSDCGCSTVVMKSLMQRGPRKDYSEEIIWLGSKNENFEALRSLGFPIRMAKESEFDQKQLAGVPTLLVSNDKRQIIYAGGYSSQKLREPGQVADRQIIDHLIHNKPVANFPIFGCIVSQKYRQTLDPFSLKYSQRSSP